MSKEQEYLDHLELAWGIIANSSGGDWKRESEEWQLAAVRWRDRYHDFLNEIFYNVGLTPEDTTGVNLSWFTGKCVLCRFPVVVTQPDIKSYPDADYWWYCSNKGCVHHALGVHTGDMEIPAWVEQSHL